MKVSLPVVRVTVLEDRASVRRAGPLELPLGHRRVRIEGLAPVLVDKTLSVVGEGVQVGDVTIRRQQIHRTAEVDSAEIEGLRAEERELRRTLAELDARAEGYEGEVATLARALELQVAEVGEDAAWGRTSEDWRADFVGLREAMEEARAEVARIRGERKLRDQELRDLRQRLQAMTDVGVDRRCSLEVDVTVEREGATLQVDYIVPSAAWRPTHRAHLLPDGRVRFETEACVWQRTGEDWADVELRVSTERTSAGAEPPTLHTDELRVQPKDAVVRVEAREREVETLGTGEAPRMAEAAELPGVDDGGSAILREVTGPVRIPSDGRPHRALLGSFQTEAEVAFVCMPELEAAVVLRTRLRNESTEAILAGPVELFRDAGPAGRSRVLYVAPGERFDLGWGPEPSLRVHREAREEPTESGMLSRWVETPHRVTVRVGHLGLADRSYDVELVERVPVSELEAVRVEVDGDVTSEGARPDADGFVRWQHRMRPRDRWQVELRWTLAKKKDVVGV